LNRLNVWQLSKQRKDGLASDLASDLIYIYIGIVHSCRRRDSIIMGVIIGVCTIIILSGVDESVERYEWKKFNIQSYYSITNSSPSIMLNIGVFRIISIIDFFPFIFPWHGVMPLFKSQPILLEPTDDAPFIFF